MKGIMKRISAFFLCTLVVMGMTIGMTVPSYAATDVLSDVVSKLEKYENSNDSAKKRAYDEAVEAWQDITDSANEANADVKIKFAGVTKEFTNTVTDSAVNGADENYINAYTTMNGFLKKVGESNTDLTTVPGAKSQLDEMVNTMNAQANVIEGANSLQSVMPLVNTITGAIVVIVLLGMAIFTAFDVAYLVFPVAKQQMDKAGSTGGKMASKTDAKTGEAKFRWVTDDAIQSYTEATESGKHPLTTYLKKRLLSYIAVAVVVFMLMSGNLAVIINFVLQMLGSVFEMLGNLSVSK